MTTSEATELKPLWLSMENQILKATSDISGGNLEAAIQKMAGALDKEGYNVSSHGGNLMKLRFAADKMRKTGKPMMQDFNSAVSKLTLDDVADPFAATGKLLDELGETWPELKSADRRPDVVGIMEQTKLDLLIAKAKGLESDLGIRLLIGEGVDFTVITAAMEISDEKVNEVDAQIKAELAEIARVEGLLEKVADKSNEEKVRFLFDNNVTEELMMEIGGVSQGDIDAANQAMEEEIKEKQRLAEEEAARKKAEAEGPSLEDIPADQMVDLIDSIREIMEFSDQEKEIRVMCEQSSIPKALVDIAVSDPDKLDELEKQAEG